MEEQIGKHSKLLSNSGLIELRFSVKHSFATIPTQETLKKKHNNNRKLVTICRYSYKHGIRRKITQRDSDLNQNMLIYHILLKLMSQIDQALYTAKKL